MHQVPLVVAAYSVDTQRAIPVETLVCPEHVTIFSLFYLTVSRGIRNKLLHEMYFAQVRRNGEISHNRSQL